MKTMKKIQTKNKNLSIYIHIPFCESRCYYCDFYSSVFNSEIVEKYFSHLNIEIEKYGEFLEDKIIDTIFIGGGTPSSVNPKYISNILNKIKSLSTISKDCEITIELNPNSIDENKIETYLDSNINRFSMGAQSFNNDILKTIGRNHRESDIFNSVNLLHKYNIKNISLDLMLALPNQSMRDVQLSIEHINKLELSHISYYSLILEDGTILKKMHDKNSLNFPSEELDRKMYHYILNSLDNLGYKQYEISNFAKPGYQSRHNLNYWKLNNYLGLGVSSHSNIDNVRFYNFSNFNKHFKALSEDNFPIEDSENLSIKDRINEFTIMGLRLNSGVNINEINKRFKIDFREYYREEIQKNIDHNLIYIEDNSVVLTKLGLDLSNIVEVDFLRL
ncbi:oxygen-independent coproporphyrinogen-3 oxidase [Anaerosphaera aminiphila DSM 21120]|uniref:Heme chaperone HemW n=2 Tax=Anaerosphaera TaxID=1273095 RepID=A0A1M5RM69_9FIRM|nr:oxygen-independent coproporphyrinogen-3 oxidase [Anaerosphaera aminiphila DSM 21120]